MARTLEAHVRTRSQTHRLVFRSNVEISRSLQLQSEACVNLSEPSTLHVTSSQDVIEIPDEVST